MSLTKKVSTGSLAVALSLGGLAVGCSKSSSEAEPAATAEEATEESSDGMEAADEGGEEAKEGGEHSCGENSCGG